jgi:hypothetical protein
MATQTPQVATYLQQFKIGNHISAIARQIPDRKQVFPVFSLIVFFVFTWALYCVAYQVPSWLGYLSIWNVVTLVIYVLAFALFESVIVLGFLLLICLVIPARFFKEIFIAQGSAIVVVISGVALLIQLNIGVLYAFEFWQSIIFILLFLIALAAIVLLFASLIWRFNRLQSQLEALANRMVVFGYFYLTCGLLSLVVVLMRIIF